MMTQRLELVKVAMGSSIVYDTKPGWSKPERLSMSMDAIASSLLKRNADMPKGTFAVTITARVIVVNVGADQAPATPTALSPL